MIQSYQGFNGMLGVQHMQAPAQQHTYLGAGWQHWRWRQVVCRTPGTSDKCPRPRPVPVVSPRPPSPALAPAVTLTTSTLAPVPSDTDTRTHRDYR